MTRLLRQAVEAVEKLPPGSQNEVAQAILSLVAGEAKIEEIDPSHLSDVLQGLAQARVRQFATETDVESAFRRFGE